MTIRNHFGKIISLLLLAGIILFYLAIPYLLKPSLELAIRGNGFPRASIGQIKFLSNGIFIDQILLDPNGFTEADDVVVTGSWRDMALRHVADRITIKKLSVSGEISSEGQIDIAGWTKPEKIQNKKEAAELPFQSLFIEGITLDADTPQGAIRVTGKLSIDPEGNGSNKKIALSLVTGQKQLAADIDIKAVLDQVTGAISGRAKLYDGSINFKPFSAGRISANANFIISDTLQVNGDASAGMIKYDQVSLEEGRLTFDTAKDPMANFTAKTANHPVNVVAAVKTTPTRSLNFAISSSSLDNVYKLLSPDSEDNPWLIKATNVQINGAVEPTFLTKKEMVLSLQSNFAGGKISVAPFIYNVEKKSGTPTLKLASIPMENLIEEGSSLSAKGRVSGQFPLLIAGNSITVNNGYLNADMPGSFRYNPQKPPTALRGDDPRMETVRLALSNYEFDILQVKMNGDVNGNLQTSLSAKGRSPAFPGRPVNLNLNLEGALAAAVRQALQPGVLTDTIKDKITKGQQ